MTDRRPRGRPPGDTCPDEAIALLGTMPDTELAQQLGAHVQTIRAWRRARDIPVYRRQPALQLERRPRPGRPLGSGDLEHARRSGVTVHLSRVEAGDVSACAHAGESRADTVARLARERADLLWVSR